VSPTSLSGPTSEPSVDEEDNATQRAVDECNSIMDVMTVLELHADTRGTGVSRAVAASASVFALTAAAVVVWFESGGAAVLAVIGLLYLALAWYLTRFRANPPLLFRIDHEGLHAFAAGNPTVRIQLGGRVARVRWLELAEVRTRLKTGGLSLQLITDGSNPRRLTVHPWMAGMMTRDFVAEMRRRAESVDRAEPTRWPSPGALTRRLFWS